MSTGSSRGPRASALESTETDPELRGTRFCQQAPETIALDVAENVLLLDELSDLMAVPPLVLTRHDLNYPHDSIGEPVVRQAIADLLSKSWDLALTHRLRGEHVLCTPGVSAALHLHARARLRHGDTALVPSPYWQMFDRIYGQAGVRIAPVAAPTDASSAIDLDRLEQVHRELVACGSRPRLLLLTNPHNPLGTVESVETLRTAFDWVLEHTDMEIISDEVYAHCRSDPATPFVSALATEASVRHPERVHVVWGFAKDFGLSGWMAGALLTRSDALHAKITRQYARFSPFDGLKNRMIRRLLCERGEAGRSPHELLQLLTARLTCARLEAARALDEQGLDYAVGSSGAPFFWLDLRRYLDVDWSYAPHPAESLLHSPELTGLDAREGRLQRYLACAAGVVLLRGQVMHAAEPGFFRLCFSAEPTQRVVEAVERVGAALRT